MDPVHVLLYRPPLSNQCMQCSLPTSHCISERRRFPLILIYCHGNQDDCTEDDEKKQLEWPTYPSFRHTTFAASSHRRCGANALFAKSVSRRRGIIHDWSLPDSGSHLPSASQSQCLVKHTHAVCPAEDQHLPAKKKEIAFMCLACAVLDIPLWRSWHSTLGASADVKQFQQHFWLMLHIPSHQEINFMLFRFPKPQSVLVRDIWDSCDAIFNGGFLEM